jgi:cytochrome b-561
MKFYAGVLAKVFAVIGVIMVVSWAQGKDVEKKYLGGLDWNDKALVFNWHPVLMIVGLLGCFGFGITSFQNNIIIPKPINKGLHVGFYITAICCFSFGLKAVWNSHDDTPDGSFKANLYTIHSWLGLACVALFGQNFLLGLLHFANPSLALEIKQNYMPNHVFLGMITFVTAVMAMETGLTEKNGFLSCGYQVTSKDSNPADNYYELPEGCRLSNGIGMVVYATALLVVYSLWTDKRPEPELNRSEAVEESLLGGAAF